MDMLDARLADMIAKIEDGSEFALVLAPASNNLDIREARCIIRLIGTSGGRQLACHELLMGKTASGFYGDAAHIASTAHRCNERYKNFYGEEGFRWAFAREIDLPPNLMV